MLPSAPAARWAVRRERGEGVVHSGNPPADVPGSLSDLIGRAAAGDQAAWGALVDRYTNLLWSVGRAHRLDTADAGDVVQTTWLRLVENLDRIQDPERLAGWLVTTARRECLRILRRSGREVVGAADDLSLEIIDDAPAIDARLLADERDAALWQCFERLTARCQQLLRVLMAAEPPAYAEVSASLGMPIGSIGPTRGRCLDQLRQFTREAGFAFEPRTVEGSNR